MRRPPFSRNRHCTRRPSREDTVTVCIAAISENGTPQMTLFAASDRMLTSLAQYQSPEAKVRPLTSSIIVMWSGDASFQAGILNNLRADIQARVDEQPEDWLEVGFVAYRYQEHYNAARKRLAEQSVLAPYGLDTTSFLAAQRTMMPRLVDRLADGLSAFLPPSVEALIVGMDLRGAHIYECENIRSPGDVHCHDALGFAAIGSGGYQASSQFMLAGHGPSRPRTDTLFLTYLAKKRAQSAPGVGDETDIFVCEDRAQRRGIPGAWAPLNLPINKPLEDAYLRLETAEGKAMAKAGQALRVALKSYEAPDVPPGQSSGGPGTIIGDLPRE
jgi:hypothetical protein